MHTPASQSTALIALKAGVDLERSISYQITLTFPVAGLMFAFKGWDAIICFRWGVAWARTRSRMVFMGRVQDPDRRQFAGTGSLASISASRRSVLTRSPALIGISEWTPT